MFLLPGRKGYHCAVEKSRVGDDAGESGGGQTVRGGGRLSALDVATYGLLAAVALIFGYVEALFPLPIPVPGVKLGLGNVVVLLALAGFGWRPGLAVMLVKVVASALLFGNPSVFAYSLAGALASFAAMWGALHVRRLSLVGVSMVGGVAHMLGQAAVVAAVLAPYVALVYLPVLMVAGLITGLLTGYVCRMVARAVGRSTLFRRRARELAKAQARTRVPGMRDAGETLCEREGRA